MGFFSNLAASFKVSIRCDLSRQVYFPGNIVEGVVIVQTNSPVDFRAIRLKLAGKQRTSIERRHTTTRTVNGKTESHTHVEHHVETAVVYKQLITLAGNMKFGGWGGSNHFMPPGTYYYPFSVQLPNDLPPTVSRRGGGHSSEIFFYAKAYVDIPMGRDAVSKCFFNILRPMPLAQWQNPCPLNFDKQFHVVCCCCIDKGYVRAKLYMTRTVIAMDRDDLMVYAEVDNTDGKEPVRSLNVDLRGVMRFRARGHAETLSWSQKRTTIPQVIPPGGKGVYQGTIHLPRTAIPTFSSPLCEVNYSIVAELDIPMASNPSASFSVLVGQSVDESNYSPPIVHQSNPYRIFNKGSVCPEFYYYPPQQPVFAVNMIPMAGAPPPQFYMPPPTIAVGVPNRAWVAETSTFVPLGVKEQHMQFSANAPAIQFQLGMAQPVAEVTITSPHAPPPGSAYGAVHQSSGAPSPVAQEQDSSKGYGTLAQPLM